MCSYVGSGWYRDDLFCRFDQPDHGKSETIQGYHVHPEATLWPILERATIPHRDVLGVDTLVLPS